MKLPPALMALKLPLGNQSAAKEAPLNGDIMPLIASIHL
jgi:hypothetical protein